MEGNRNSENAASTSKGGTRNGTSNNMTREKPVTSFSQSQETVEYLIESNYENLDSNSWSIGVSNGEVLTVRLVVKPPNIWLARIQLYEKLKDLSPIICFPQQNYTQMIIRLAKYTPVKWKTIGSPLRYHNKLLNSFETPDDYYPVRILEKVELTPAQFEYKIQTGPNVKFGVPVGWSFIFMIPGQPERRCYTPVLLKNVDTNDGQCQVITFLIKIHERGKLTRKLRNLPLNQFGALHIGSIGGFFDTDFLIDTDRLLLIGGGTGVAPFVGLLNYLQSRRGMVGVKQVILVLCGRVEKGLLWDEVWKDLAKTGVISNNIKKGKAEANQNQNPTKWFFYLPYVTSKMRESQSSSNNQSRAGPGAGRLNSNWIKSNLENVPWPEHHHEPLKMKGMGCGPFGFLDTCRDIFRSLKIKGPDIFTFDED